MLNVNDISFNYPGQQAFNGLRNVSFSVTPGTVHAVIGSSGSGKTTLLKCIYGLEDLSSGSVMLNGDRIAGPSDTLMPGHPSMRLVSQDYYVLDNHTVLENFNDALSGYADSYKASRSGVLMRLLDLQPLAGVKCRNLSSGQKQRVAIGRSLAVIPAVLLLDEPFSNLDIVLAERIFSFIRKEVKKKKTTVVLVSHHPEDALRYADNVTVLDKGRNVQTGNASTVYYKPRNLRVARLLGPVNAIKGAAFGERSPYHARKKIMLRPDQLVPCMESVAHVRMTVLGSFFNGKCHEWVGEAVDGSTLIVYAPLAAEEGRQVWLQVA